MRRLRYGAAMSLDGFIAGPNGEHDWIVPDSAIDFALIHAQFDTLLMGRRTYEVARVRAAQWPDTGHRWVVVSRTLKPEDCPGVMLVSNGVSDAISALKNQQGKDIWLMGGGVLFRSLLDAGFVDAVDVIVMPVLLGSGTPLLSEGRRQNIHLTESKVLPCGILMLSYAIPMEM